MNKIQLKILRQDLLLTLDKYPGLKVLEKHEIPIALNGNLAIIDNEGNLQREFKINVQIPNNYPENIPVLFVHEGLVNKDTKHHFNNDGSACLGTDAELLLKNPKGFSIFDFIDNYTYNYLCAQLYYEGKKVWPGGEWDHGTNGTKAFYFTKLKTDDIKFVILCLKMIIKHHLPRRNKPCFCNSTLKSKNCHLPILEELSKLKSEFLENEIKLLSDELM